MIDHTKHCRSSAQPRPCVQFRSLLILACCIGPPAAADVLEEVVVTAQKREQSLQDVPLSMSAFTQDALDKKGIAGLMDVVDNVPTMQIQVPNGVVWAFMRGTGNSNPTAGGDNSLAFHYDGVYMGYSTAALVNLWDVERLEILRGPQGTLYGRNATGGSINVIPNRPQEEFQGSVDAAFGDFSTFALRGMVNPGSWGSVRTRMAFSHQQHDGYQENLLPGGADGDEDDSWMLRLLADFDLG